MIREVQTRIEHRSDTSANWSARNPVLGTGEIGYETDTGLIKIGNGSDAWKTLAYVVKAITSAEIDEIMDEVID